MSINPESAEKVIKEHIILSMTAAILPIPGVDLIAVTAIQLDMIKQLAKIYEIDFDMEKGKSLASSLAGASLARIGASAAKMIPGIGTITGAGIQVILSGASTYALGQVFKMHFDGKGDLFTFSVNEMKKQYEKFFDQGKEVAKNLKKEEKVNEADVFSQIEKLKKLEDIGAISHAEFEETKAKLLKKITD